MLGINTAPVSGRRVSSASPPSPAASSEFATLFKQALDYVTAIGAVRSIARRQVPPEAAAGAEMTFIRISRGSPMRAQEKNVTLLIDPIPPQSRDRPDYFLTRAEQAAESSPQGGAAERAHAVRLLSRPDRRGDLITRFENICRSSPCADRRRAVAVRARRGRGELSEISRALDRLGYGKWVGCEYRPPPEPRRLGLGRRLRVNPRDVCLWCLTLGGGLGRLPLQRERDGVRG